jgi:hypothetical protein
VVNAVGTLQTGYPRIQASSQDKRQGVHPRTATCPASLDQASLLKRAPMLPCVSWLQTSPLRLGGVRCCHASHGSRPHSALEVGSGAAACSMAPDLTSLPKGAPVLPHVHVTLWVIGIKKGLAALGVQRGLQVTKLCPYVTEAPARRAGRRCHHNMQDVRAGGYSTTLQCGTTWLTALRRGWQGS